MIKIQNHTLAFVRWMNACSNAEELSFCNQVLLQFIIRGESLRCLASDVAWYNINSYLLLCMQNKRHTLQQAHLHTLIN